MIPGIQIIGTAYAIAMIYISYKKFKKQEFQGHELLGWATFWISFAIITVFPEILNTLPSKLHTSRPLDLIVIIGFLFLLAVVFQMYCENKKMNARIEKLVQRLALQDEKKTRED